MKSLQREAQEKLVKVQEKIKYMNLNSVKYQV